MQTGHSTSHIAMSPCESCPGYGFAYYPQDKPVHASRTHRHHHHHLDCPLSTSLLSPLPLSDHASIQSSPSSTSPSLALCSFLWSLLSEKCSCKYHTPSIPKHTSPKHRIQTLKTWNPRSRLISAPWVSSRRRATKSIRSESNDVFPLRLLATGTETTNPLLHQPLPHLASHPTRNCTNPFQAKDHLVSINTPSLPSTSTYSHHPSSSPLENNANLCLEKEIEATDRPPWIPCLRRNNPTTKNSTKMFYSSSLYQIMALLLLVLLPSVLLRAEAAPTFASSTPDPLLLGVGRSNTVAMNLSNLPSCDPSTMTGTNGRRSEAFKDGRIRLAAINHGTGYVLYVCSSHF